MEINFLGIIKTNIWVIYGAYIIITLLLVGILITLKRRKYSLLIHAAYFGSLIALLVPISWVIYGGFIGPGFPQDVDNTLHNLFWVAGVGMIPFLFLVTFSVSGLFRFYFLKAQNANNH